MITILLRQPHRIVDERLRLQVEQCVACDDIYSPLVDKLRASIGNEYEYRLQQTLRNRNIAFLTETEMSARGYPKTPDIKFEVPILLDDEHVINWIESKASFGDLATGVSLYVKNGLF